MKSSPILSQGLLAGSVLVVLLNLLFFLKPYLDNIPEEGNGIYSSTVLIMLLTVFYAMYHFFKLQKAEDVVVFSLVAAGVAGIGVAMATYIHAAFIDTSLLANSMQQAETYWAEHNYSEAAIAGQAEHYMLANPINYGLTNGAFFGVFSFLVSMVSSVVYMVLNRRRNRLVAT